MFMDVGIVRIHEGDMKAGDVYGCWDCTRLSDAIYVFCVLFTIHISSLWILRNVVVSTSSIVFPSITVDWLPLAFVLSVYMMCCVFWGLGSTVWLP